MLYVVLVMNCGASARAHLLTMNNLLTSRTAIALIAFCTGTLTTAFLLRHSGYGEHPTVSAREVPSLSTIYLIKVKKSVTGTSIACDVISLICIDGVRACVINNPHELTLPAREYRNSLCVRSCK